jgi:site-specific DNA recombinase
MKYFIYCRRSSESEDRQILSIESQQSELKRAFGDNPAIEIVDAYEESFSAKAPGRPRFDEMMARIARGEADGIVAWHPDRLARNSVDGGKIIWYLDRKLIKDLKFATYTFENNPQGKFMLSIFLGQSKYYVDALSENVKRGNRTKIEKGWRPNLAPTGYLNCKVTKTIVVDAVRFPLVRRMFDLMLSGQYSVREIYELARDDWALRSVRRKRIGGNPIVLAGIYRILTNPFYAGVIPWKGQLHPGKHQPLITLDEFDIVQRRLGRPHAARPQKKQFAFTGLIRCGSCGLAVTAEDKINPYGSRYTYYHCTKRNVTSPRCRQRVVNARDLEAQILDFLRKISLPERQHEWALEQIRQGKASREATEKTRIQSLEKAYSEATRSLNTLTDLRLRDMIGDDEFQKKRRELQQEALRLRNRLSEADTAAERFEPVADLIMFNARAVDWFLKGTIEVKRLILEIVGSNSTLKDKILSIEARKPFALCSAAGDFPTWWAIVEDVRTFYDDPEFKAMLSNIRHLKKLCQDQPDRQVAA